MPKKKNLSLLGLDKPINKKKIILTVLMIFSPFILFGLLCVCGSIYLIYIDYLPIPEYQKKIEPTDLRTVCKRIKDGQLQEVCFTIAKNKDFERGLVLTAKIKDDLARAQGKLIEGKGYLNYLEYFPWYYYDGIYSSGRSSSIKNGIEKLVAEAAGHNPINWCRDFFTLSDGTLSKENYCLCRAFLENPHFCKRIYSDLSEVPKDKMKRLCYEDAALVWKDPFLCEKSLNQDFCYIRLVLKYLEENQEKEKKGGL